MENLEKNQGEIIIYQSDDGNTKIDVTEENQLMITLFLVVNENVVIKEWDAEI